MARVKRPVSEQAQEWLAMLDEAGGYCAELETALTAARERRDRLARRASETGATRRDVARAARLTAGRVQQLLG